MVGKICYIHKDIAQNYMLRTKLKARKQYTGLYTLYVYIKSHTK